MKKQFFKIGGVKSDAEFYERYPTEDAFFTAHPEARNMMAMGGMPETFPQIATADNFFNYGIPPGPQYLATGGSTYPQAQTEQQFFIPIYTDVYNPYNKAMGGSNTEMYPNANVPRVGPTNIYFQDGGQEEMQGMEQPDRLGVLNRTGSFVNNLKSTAAKANSKNAIMGAMDNMGMAKYGKELNRYALGATKYAVSGQNQPFISQQVSPTSSQFGGEATPPTYNQQLQSNMTAALQQQYAQQLAQMMQNYAPQGDMSNLINALYNPRDQNQFMFQKNRGVGYGNKFRTDVPGMGRERGYSNMPFMQAYFPELYGDPAAAQKALNDPKYADRRKQLGLTQYTETPIGLFKRRMKRDYYFGDTGSSNAPFKFYEAGPGASPQQVTSNNSGMSAYGPYADGYNFEPDSASAATSSSPATAANNSSYMSPENYEVINQFENSIGTYDPSTGQAIGMGRGDQYAQTADKEKIESYINSTIGKDTWNKLPENVKTQAYSFMFNNGVVNKDGTTNYNSLNGLAQAIDNATGGGDLGDQRRAYTPEQSISKIKGADLSNPDLYNNYVNVLGDQYGSIAKNTSQYQSGPGANYAPTLQGRAVSIDNIMNSRGMNSMIPMTTTGQAPSNANSMDAATAQKKASMQTPNVNQAYIDSQMQSGSPYRTPVGPVAEQSGMDYTEPVSPYESAMAKSMPASPSAYLTGAPYRTPAGPIVGPEGFAYGGYTGYKNGGSYNQGDVVYMSDDEIAQFVRNGGQIEEME